MELEPLPSVELTKDEQRECREFIKTLVPEGETGYALPEVADELNRGFISMALFQRAHRLILGSRAAGRHAAIEEGCQAAVKACCIYPVAVNFFECGRVFTEAGRQDDAKGMFREFLRRYPDELASDPAVTQEEKQTMEDLAASAREELAPL